MSASLLPLNAIKPERDIEATIERPLKTSIADLWNPMTCPVEHLPWLAWALSVDQWKPYWPENVKRAVCAKAIDIQRRKGSVKSVRDVVATFGGNLVLREWFDMEPEGDPRTFEVTLTVQGVDGEAASAEYVDDVINEIAATKPLAAHFTFTQGLQAIGAIGMAAGAQTGVYRRMQFEEANP